MIKKINIALTVIIISTISFSLQGYADESDKQNTEYAVKVNDVLNISVLEHDDLKSTVAVMSDGSISFPYIGTINVKGMTVEEIKKVITEKLASDYVKYPVVSVSISTHKSIDFFVYGEVLHPGRFPFEDNMTVFKALSLAGGITPDGLYGNIRLKRKRIDKDEYKEIVINLKLKGKGDTGGDMQIQADDLIIVGRNKDFFVYGEVIQPGKYTLEDNMTVLKAISLAGGFTKYGSSDKVKILRTVPGKAEYESIKIDMRAAIKGQSGKDIHLEPNDILVVSEGLL
jgi:polysaccharide export outer membrane protein